jgi:putative redox protein
VVVRETLSGTYQVEATAAGRTFLVDEPVAAGGMGSGPDPFDFLGAALASCTSMTVRLYAQTRLWPLHRISVSVVRHGAGLHGRDRFERTITLDGDLDDTQRIALLEIAKVSPVQQVLERSSTVETTLGPIGSAPDDAQRIEIEHYVALQQALRAS